MVFLPQKLIYIINIWFNFVCGSFFKQNHLLQSFWEFTQKDDLNEYISENRNSCGPKCDWWIFFSLWLLKDLCIRRILSEKNYRSSELISEKNPKLCMQNLTKERKQPPVVIPQQVIFRNILILSLWLRIIRRSNRWCLVYEFSFTDIF